MMPVEGKYELRKITIQEFVNKIKQTTGIVSYIRYEKNIELIKDWTGIEFKPNAGELKELSKGDIMLVMKLNYRPPTTQLKTDKAQQDALTTNDFTFYECEYLGQ